MPGFITHSLFARDVCQNLKNSELRNEIEKRMPLYYLGAQGPDIFFYYKAKPWVKYDGVEKLGLIMHDNNTSDFFMESLDYLKSFQKSDRKKFQELTVYMAGYLCHFALDYTAHPFIHYTAGVYTKRNNSSYSHHLYHKELESIIDAYMLKLKENKPAHRFKDFELIEGISDYQDTLEDFYIYIIEKIYMVELSREQVKNAIGDISDILRILYDPWHIKIWVFRLVENLYGKHGEITSAVHPRRVNTDIDYLNLNKSTWIHPCNRDIKSSRSFLDLYDEALEEAHRLIDAAVKYLDNEVSSSRIRSYINDTSYSTGLECGTEKELKYFDSIFENPRMIDKVKSPF